MSKHTIVDLKEVLDRLEHDRELLIELISDFIKDYDEKRKALSGHIDDKNFESVQQMAHSLKGSAGNISVKSMYDCFMLMEFLAKNKELELLIEIMVDIDSQIEELKKFLPELKKK